jgi:hypothetical protein
MTPPLSNSTYPQAQDYSSADTEEDHRPSSSTDPSFTPQSSSSSTDSDDTARYTYPSITIYPEPKPTQLAKPINMPPEIRVQPPRRSTTISLDARPAIADDAPAYPNLAIYPATPTHPQPPGLDFQRYTESPPPFVRYRICILHDN